MIKSLLKYSLVLALVLLLGGNAMAQKERKQIRKGNKEYYLAINDTGAVDTIVMQNAEVRYRKALDENINSYEAGFNLGNSLYKQQKFDEAAEQYELLVTKSDDKKQLGEAYYNLGNAQLGGGKLEESIATYKQSLRMNPSDTAAKYNLAVAQKLLEEAEQQQQQQQQDQNQDQQDQDQQDQDQQENQDQENQDQQQQDQEQQEQQQKEEQEKQEQQQAEEGDEEKEEEQMQQAQKDEISKEDAERMLKALQMEEKKVLQKLQDQKSKQRPKKLEKDW